MVEHPAQEVAGGLGQLGRALAGAFPDADLLTRADLDIDSADSVAAFDFDHVETIINAAAWTAVDAAETPEGRAACWRTNVTGVGRLVEVARRHRATLVHVSSDYVFDGTREVHTEDEPLSPVGAYGASKAAGDALGIDLLNDPWLVERDPSVAWATALWYWNTQNGPGTMTSHDAMVGGAGFGETIRSLNGALECDGGNPASVAARVERYERITGIVGVAPGSGLTC